MWRKKLKSQSKIKFLASNGETLEIKGFEKEIFQKKGKLFKRTGVAKFKLFIVFCKFSAFQKNWCVEKLYKRTGVAKFKLFNNKKSQNFSFSKELVLQNVNFQKNWCCKV